MYVVYEPSRLKVSLSAIVLGIPMETKKLQKKEQEKDSSVRETENGYDNVTLWTPNNTEKKQKTEKKGIGN